MKTRLNLLLAITLLGSSTTLLAAEDTLSSRSAGKLQADAGIDLGAARKSAEVTIRARPAQAENYAQSPDATRQAGIANRHDQLFEIYSADAQLIGDLDRDGYHHAFRVNFDVDVNYDSATVYAKLYLSREGGPWGQYFTTSLFHIHGDDIGDTYEVETELLEGYPPGYYAVLVEIYSLDHAYMIASEVLDYHYLGIDLTLEDLVRDGGYVGSHGEIHAGIHYSTYGGSIGWLLAFFLIVQVVIAARGALATTPCKKAKTRKTKAPLRCGPYPQAR